MRLALVRIKECRPMGLLVSITTQVVNFVFALKLLRASRCVRGCEVEHSPGAHDVDLGVGN